MSDSPSGVIRITRPTGLRGTLSSFEVHLDGEAVGSISDGKTVQYEVPVGAHSVQVKIWHTGSPARTVTVEDGGIEELVVTVAGKPWSLWRELTSSKYLNLEAKE